jgi:hypothetical protein
MTQAITRLFDDHEAAAAAVRQLEADGVPHDDISLIVGDSEGRLTGGRRDRVDDGDNDAAEGAAKGAATGGLIGGGAGLLAGLGMLAIPGLGPVVAVGWLASTAVGALVGAAGGGAAGGLLGALKDAGHSDADANVYAEGVRRGGALVSVRPSNDADTATAERILNGGGGVDAATRGAAYREAGWRSFDPEAAPLNADQLAAERLGRQEDRSFGGERRDDVSESQGRSGQADSNPAPRPVDPTQRGA